MFASHVVVLALLALFTLLRLGIWFWRRTRADLAFLVGFAGAFAVAAVVIAPSWPVLLAAAALLIVLVMAIGAAAAVGVSPVVVVVSLGLWAVLLAPVFGFTGFAHAQDVAATLGPALGESWSAWIISTCVTILTGAIVLGIRSWLGIQLGQAAQDHLHRALETGAKAAAARSGIDETVDEKIDGMIAYAKKSVPDSVKRLAPPADILREIASGKLAEALGQIAPLPRS